MWILLRSLGKIEVYYYYYVWVITSYVNYVLTEYSKKINVLNYKNKFDWMLGDAIQNYSCIGYINQYVLLDSRYNIVLKIDIKM